MSYLRWRHIRHPNTMEVVFIYMSKHTDKINAMKTAGKAMEDKWSKSKITPEKNEELMKQKENV